MGMLVVLAVVVALLGCGWLFVHAVSGEGKNRHGWLIVLPLIVMFGWLIEQLIMR
jgi:hypothetical protein